MTLSLIHGGSPPEPPPEPEAEDLRPEVRLTSANPHQAIDEIAALLCHDRDMYVRGKQLVTIVGALPVDEDAPAPMAESTPVIMPLEGASLTERVTRHIRLVRHKPLTKKQQDIVDMGGRAPPTEWVPALPSPLIINGLRARGQWPLRHLTSVSETPVFRPDGTILQTPGYDATTGYVYKPLCEFPDVPESPTREDAAQALAALSEVFVDFPYANDAARMVPIAAVLTVLARSAIDGACPAFLLDATTRGSGKTLQADAVSAVTLGRSAARKSYPVDQEELGKTLAAYAIAGARLVLFDNVPAGIEFGGGELDQAITARDTVEIRVLGRTEVKRLPWNAVIMASGNNIAMGEDTVRRVLVARLESPLENPEDRHDFKHPDLFDWILSERPRLVVAALTILRAFARFNGHRHEGKAWGSFEAWSRLIPGALVYAGGADPMLARPSLEEHTNDGARAILTVLDMLPKLDAAIQAARQAEASRRGERPENVVGLTTREIVAALYPDNLTDADRNGDGWQDLRDALEAWTHPKPGQKPSLQTLGIRLRGCLGRCIGGKRLKRETSNGKHQTPRWLVV